MHTELLGSASKVASGADDLASRSPSAVAAGNPTECVHCALPIPDARRGNRFCCSGCEAVHALLRHADLDSYYQVRERAPARAAEEVTDTYRCFDDETFINEQTRAVGDLREVDFYLEGVHCHACVWLVEKLGRVVPGVVSSELSYSDRCVRVRFEPRVTSPGGVATGLARLGYLPHARVRSPEGALAAREDRALLLRLGVSGAAAGNVMLLAFALYSGAASDVTSGVSSMMRLYSAVIAVPAVLWSATPFFRGAWAAVRTRTAHMDLPISIGILAGLGWGAFNTLTNRGEIYFDSVCMLVFLLLAGRFLQLRQMRKAQGQAEFLLALAPTHAERITSQGVQRVRAEQIVRGDHVRVRSGQPIPIDGVVTVGESRVDTALLTGESRPRAVRAGSEVLAGSLNVQAPIEIQATSSGGETKIAGLLRSFASIRAERSAIRVLADRLSGGFVVVASLLAGLAFWIGARQGAAEGVERAVALLVVTCPCALGLAASVGNTLAMGRAARQGLLIKGGIFIEALARPGLMVFDKTGTLTEGRLRVTECIEIDSARCQKLGYTSSDLLLALEVDSSHPIARAIERAFAGPVRRLPALEKLREHVGRGVEARLGGSRLRLGSLRFVSELVHDISPEVERACKRLREKASSPVVLSVDDGVVCVLGLSDPLRAEAPTTLQELARQGYELAVASGDDPEIVRQIAAATGVRFRFALGGLSPEQKYELVQENLARGAVYMVGDGVNDGAALAGASVGIAVHGGAEASLAVADVFATRPGLGTIADLVRGARRTMRVIRRNFAFSLAYNLITALLAIAGYITPLVAAVLMPLSSFLIATSSFSSRTFTEGT
jgi:Cu2+-exporting ATPase